MWILLVYCIIAQCEVQCIVYFIGPMCMYFVYIVVCIYDGGKREYLNSIQYHGIRGFLLKIILFPSFPLLVVGHILPHLKPYFLFLRLAPTSCHYVDSHYPTTQRFFLCVRVPLILDIVRLYFDDSENYSPHTMNLMMPLIIFMSLV